MRELKIDGSRGYVIRLIRTQAEIAQFLSSNSDGELMATFNNLFLRSVFQPIFRADESILGFEALIRAKTREGIPLSPAHIFRNLEQDHPDFIQQISIDKLSRLIHLRNFTRLGEGHLLFINMLPSTAVTSFNTYSNQNLLISRLADLNIPRSRVVLEIVEHPHLDTKKLSQAIKISKENGFKIAVDDYGTQYSNEARVREIRPDILKIDRSLLLEYMKDNQTPLLEAIALAKDVHAEILVEGIERQEEYDAMRKLEIHYFQGFFLGIPHSYSAHCNNNQ